MIEEETFELNQFKEAAYEGDTKHALKAVKELARIRDTDKLTVLLTLHFVFENSPRVIKFISFLISGTEE